MGRRRLLRSRVLIRSEENIICAGRILSGEPTEIVVKQIHDYLTRIGDNRLGKNPEDYPDAEGQPRVQVALKMKPKGGNTRAGYVIPYVFCVPEGEEGTKSNQSDKAQHRDEVRRV
ncbi:hypothetical protein FB446DRAFT_700861 [Lentinula raphanica]|nr:hypothetical protein FB446DRAFT_700861 [Lentinula raphanica]